MAFSYNKKNLANTTITGAITPTQTSVTVADATVFSYAFFYATLMPSNEMSNASNSEIVLVTNIQGNTLTLVRGQENTIARSFPYGAVITNGIYTRDIDYARSIGRKVFMAQDDGTDNTNTSYQITDPMIKNVPEEGSIITVEFDTPSYGSPTLGVNNGIGGLVQVSGTDIHITDSSGQIDSVEMYGDTEQTTISGKNLYNLTGASQFGVEGKINSDGSYTISGTANRTEGAKVFAYVGSLPAGTYTFTISQALPKVINFSIASGIAARIAAGDTSATVTITQDYSGASVYFDVDNGASYNITLKMQLVSGSTADYDFEPYVGGTTSPNPDYPQEVQTVTGRQVVTISDDDNQSQEYEINLGKNLLPYPYVGTTTTKNGITFTVNSDGSVTVSGTATSAAWFKLSESMTLPSGCFMSGCPSGGSTTKYSLQTSYSGTVFGDYGSGVQLQAGTTDPVWIVVRSGQDFSTPVTFYPQIEKGTSKSSYASYFTPIELCKIGDYQDYIYKSGEDWYVHKDLSKIVIDGSQSVTSYGTAATGKYRYSVPVTGAANVAADVVVNVSDKFVGVTRGDTYNNVNGMYQATGLVGFYWDAISAYTTAQVQTWLSTNNVTAYYPLATSTDTKITNSALIAQLDALYNMLPEGVADVVVTGDLPGSLTIKYYQQGTGTYTAPIVGGAEIDGGDNEQVVELDSHLPYRLVYDANGYWRVLNKGPKVTTGAIADKAVTTAKLADDAVTDAQFDWFRTIDYMTVRGTSSSDVSYAAGATIPLDDTYSMKSSNTAFTNANHGIKIGAGVHRVMVCAQVFGAYDGITFVYFRLKKNSDTLLESVASIPVNSFSTGFITPVVVEVSQDDVLTLQLIEKVKVRTQATFLSVFKVE